MPRALEGAVSRVGADGSLVHTTHPHETAMMRTESLEDSYLALPDGAGAVSTERDAHFTLYIQSRTLFFLRVPPAGRGTLIPDQKIATADERRSTPIRKNLLIDPSRRDFNIN